MRGWTYKLATFLDHRAPPAPLQGQVCVLTKKQIPTSCCFFRTTQKENKHKFLPTNSCF
eukprot:m.123638 g.123638  ORF g.123638 m.123638 type:complete len:59 (+) comp14451_c0_seq3:5889-6065(+)